MILKCPACETRYALDPAKLGLEGRRVKCARCGHVWQQEPPAESEAGPAPAAPPPSAEDRVAARAERLKAEPRAAPAGSNLPAKPRKARRRTGALAALAGLLLIAVVTGLVVGRDRVAGAWPAAEGVYRALGLDVGEAATREGDVPGAGLALVDVIPEVSDSGDGRTLVVRGAITNPTDTPRAVPGFRVTLLDGERRPLESWAFRPDAERLAPGEAVTFQTSRPDPHPSTDRIEVTVDRGGR
jgi:predicted Zn finger-like uncharacterized protein